jgi:hypothetical protein
VTYKIEVKLADSEESKFKLGLVLAVEDDKAFERNGQDVTIPNPNGKFDKSVPWNVLVLVTDDAQPDERWGFSFDIEDSSFGPNGYDMHIAPPHAFGKVTE